MKKLVLALAVIASISMISCTENKTTENAEKTDSIPTEQIDQPVDTTAAQVADTVAPNEEVAPVDSAKAE